jgi:aspartate kinase
VIHPRAVKASLKTKTPIVARNTFSNAAGTIIFHHESANQSEQVTLAHRENMALIVFENATDAQRLVPEMIPIDERRFLIKNDIYLENSLKLLKTSLGTLKLEEGWSTISVVFDKSAEESINVPQTEIIPSSNNVICYLLKEDRLEVSLQLLYDHYLLKSQ